MSDEVQIYSKFNDPLEAIDRLGEMFSKSGMFGVEKVEQGKVLALACLVERKNPFEILRTFHVIHGRLSMRADAMLAGFKAIGGKCAWKTNVGDEKKAEAEFEYGENKGTFTYAVEDAKREGLVGRDTWKRSGPDMLRARLISKVVRMLAPQVVVGVYTPEEIAEELPAEAPRKLDLSADTVEQPKKAKAPVVDAEIVAPASEPPKEESKPKSPKESNFAKESAKPWLKPLSDLLLPHEKAATEWMLKNNWITEGQCFGDITEARATKILNRPDAFLRAIGVTEAK